MLGDLRRPVAAFATAALACAIGMGIFQQLQIAHLKAPRIESHYPLAGDARGAAKRVSVLRKAGLSLTLDFTPKPEFSSYQVQIVSGSGQVKASLPVAAATDQDSVTISLPANTLDSGRYSMVVYGLAQNSSKTEVGRGEFDLQLLD